MKERREETHDKGTRPGVTYDRSTGTPWGISCPVNMWEGPERRRSRRPKGPPPGELRAIEPWWKVCCLSDLNGGDVVDDANEGSSSCKDRNGVQNSEPRPKRGRGTIKRVTRGSRIADDALRYARSTARHGDRTVAGSGNKTFRHHTRVTFVLLSTLKG